MSEIDDGSTDDQRPRPGARDPDEPGYDGETRVGEEGVEVDDLEAEAADVQEQHQDR
jgi:hypothetical protein